MKNEILELLKAQVVEELVPAKPEQIERAEQRLGCSIAPPFVEWLKICNGSSGGANGIFGIEQSDHFLDLEARLALYPTWKKLGWTPIATDGCGNHYVLVFDAHVPEHFPVCFIDNTRDPDVLAYVVGSRLDLFLRFMLWRKMQIHEEWPFDEEWVTKHDPDIRNVTVAPLPWNCD